MLSTFGVRLRGMSLIEVLIAISVMGVTAIMYASAWRLNSGASEVAREIEIGTEIFMRQVERIRMKSLMDDPARNGRPAPPFALREDAYQDANISPCPPQFPGAPVQGETQYRVQNPTSNNLSYNLPISTLLRTTNCLLIPPDQPGPDVAPTFDQAWVPSLHADLQSMGFGIQVLVSRVHGLNAGATLAAMNSDQNFLHQLLKYRIRVIRTTAPGAERVILTGEFLQEVR